jgi:hypothetical protein
MDLRLATEADVDSLLAVQEQGAIRGLSYIFPQDTQPFPRDTPRARWLDEMADPAIHAYVITDDSERILGFAATQSDDSCISVRPWRLGVPGWRLRHTTL